jgi:hypothetical protein
VSVSIAPRPVELRDLGTPIGFADLTDDGLVRVQRDYRRAIEDGADAALYAAPIRTARTIQLVRLTLRMRYGATFLGTHQPDRYLRHGEAPSYWLAMQIDKHRHDNGLSHVLDGRVVVIPGKQVVRWLDADEVAE